MRKYNGLASVPKGLCFGFGMLAALALTQTLAGCAAMPAPSSPAAPHIEPAASAPVAARDVPPLQTRDLADALHDDAPLRYVVKRGDTLWDIAGYYLRDPWYWPQLWHDNPDIANPHLIYPGDILLLSTVDGQPRLSRAQSLSPRVPTLPVEKSVATVPLDAIRAFLTGPRLVAESELATAPYIVSFMDGHIVGGAGIDAYVNGAPPDGPRVYSVVRPADAFRDPETNDLLGYQALPIGQARITELDDVSTARLTRSYREALPGDRLLPIETEVLANDFYPHAPSEPIEGQIISVYDGVSAISQYDVVTLNLGASDGLERGHVLNIYESGRTVVDPVEGGQITLPDTKSGLLMIFKVDENVSFGVIMRATRAAHVFDTVRTPR